MMPSEPTSGQWKTRVMEVTVENYLPNVDGNTDPGVVVLTDSLDLAAKEHYGRQPANGRPVAYRGVYPPLDPPAKSWAKSSRSRHYHITEPGFNYYPVHKFLCNSHRKADIATMLYDGRTTVFEFISVDEARYSVFSPPCLYTAGHHASTAPSKWRRWSLRYEQIGSVAHLLARTASRNTFERCEGAGHDAA
ncbi:hypothetical protein FSPOR_8786 [Fusarium sporotrichioides]|uniref:Uncharacterized protein n=1 Tax=Fusarium sporotrichioides TaxID=5514 RepID=A0A395RT46_FUSSP|nr:hypothetical protein FSPOR_8786 [Fusarium sporotrichioides]